MSLFCVIICQLPEIGITVWRCVFGRKIAMCLVNDRVLEMILSFLHFLCVFIIVIFFILSNFFGLFYTATSYFCYFENSRIYFT